jgi:NAD(P)-dependent dehydrogenase (short-subunit alcohol dehydrogenase family)
VFVTSIGGRMAFPMFGAYHAAKFGLEAVGDVFRQELRPWGIEVSIVEPGSIATPIWERGDEAVAAIASRAGDGHEELYGEAIETGREVARKTGARGIPPEKVAAKIEHALSARRPRTRYLVGLDAKAQARLKSILPTRLVDRLIARATGM